MIRALLFGMIAALAQATPITYIFSGTADGQLGDIAFTQKDFTLAFTSDTTDLVHPPAIPVDFSTPAGTSAVFIITDVGSGTFTDDQAVFTHPSPEDDIGVWHYNTADWLAKQDPAFAAYDLASNIGPITTGVNNGLPIFNGVDNHFTTTAGNFVLSNVTALSFTAELSSPTTGVPEPATGTMLSLGIAGVLIGLRSRRSRRS